MNANLFQHFFSIKEKRGTDDNPNEASVKELVVNNKMMFIYESIVLIFHCNLQESNKQNYI